jgi:hypothetical protein
VVLYPASRFPVLLVEAGASLDCLSPDHWAREHPEHVLREMVSTTGRTWDRNSTCQPGADEQPRSTEEQVHIGESFGWIAPPRGAIGEIARAGAPVDLRQ